MLRRTIQLVALGLLAVRVCAQSAPAPNPANKDRPFFSRVSGLFGGDLPQLDPPGTMKLILRPHFGDLVHNEYMRVDTGLRWALNDDFELSSEASVFFTHGLKNSADSAGSGIGKLRFGSKYVFERWPRFDYETTLALNIDLPVGHAPIDMTDGHNHFAPNVVVQHSWRRWPRLTTFGGMGLDLVSNSPVAGRWGTNQPHENSASVTAGGVYDLGQIKWTYTTTYATTAGLGKHTDHFLYVQPGLLWYVPRKFTFHSKTQWIVGLSARTSWGPDGLDFSLSSRLRAEITFRQVMDKMRRSGSK
jgi:hypothetical protein